MTRLLRLFIAVVLSFIGGTAFSQSVTTDQSDYAPGSTAIITGSGFQSGETVELQVLNLTDPSDTGDEHEPWQVVADADGNFQSTWYVTADEGGQTLQLTATGLSSGSSAQATFTDAVTVTAATGGTGILADKAANAVSPAWTSLSVITLGEPGNDKGGIASGTLALKAPVGFEFNTAVVPSITFTGSRDITAASVVFSNATTLGISITVSGTANVDTLNIGSTTNLQVRPTSGTLLTNGIIYRPTTGGGSAIISGVVTSSSTNGAGGTPFAALSEVPGSATNLLVSGFPATQTAGVASNITVTARDQFGTVATNYTGTIHFTSSDAQAVLPANFTFTAANAGVRTFTNAVTLKTAGTRSITATDTNFAAITGTQSGITINVAPANKLGFTTQPLDTTVGANMNTVVVQIQDAFGNSISLNGTNISLALNGGGTVLGTTNLPSNANGAANFGSITVNQAGTGKTLVAFGAPFLNATSATFNVSAAGSSTALATSGSPVVHGQPVTFTATVTSAGGTPSGTVTFKDGATVLGTGTLNGSGVATFTTNRLTVSGSPHSITAVYGTDGNFGSSTSSIVSQTITVATLTVSGVTANNKVYNGSTSATLNTGSAALVGVVSGDAVSLNTGSAAGTFADGNIGINKAVTISGLTISGADSGNYSLTQPAATASITVAALTVTANDTNRVYGAADPAFIASYSGFAGTDGIGVLSGSPAFSTTATGASVVGTYPIAVTNGTLSATNYSFVFVNGQLTITAAFSTNVVSVSANPSPTGSNVTLTATLGAIAPGAGTPGGTVQFVIDGSDFGSPATLSGGVANLNTASLAHGNHTVSAKYAGDTNFFGNTNSLGGNLVINTAPTSGTFALTTTKNTAANISAVKLAASGRDADHDALSLTGLSATSAQGGTVSLNGNTITYTPANNYTGADSFTYTIADTFGATVGGTVDVTVNAPSNGQSQNITSLTVQNDLTVRLKFAGIPGHSYRVQATTNIVSPVWENIATNAFGSNGLSIFIDTDAPNNPARYYRSVVP